MYNEANGIPCDSDDLVFQRKKKGTILPCTPRVFDSRISKYCKQLQIQRKSMHDLRRTFATTLYYGDGIHGGMPIDDIRVLMGHTNISQTWEYIVKRKTIETEGLLEFI